MMKKMLAVCLLCPVMGLTACEKERPQPKVADDASRIEKATDVFWALQKWGYTAAKQKPTESSSGCKPTEYLAMKDKARFRISVFTCPTSEKAKQVVEHANTRKVNDLLRNRHEGGVLRRNKLEIIIRRIRGEAADADGLLHDLGAL